MDPRDLYGLPLEQFTEQRNALAKELLRKQRQDEAQDVSKLRKPSVAAWAVNQLVRTQRGEVAGLFKAGDALQKTQADLLAKRAEPESLRRAVAAERATVDQLIEKARGLLSSEGHELTPARLEQVSETLHAAALDQAARAQVQGGCLERELRHVGLGGLSLGAGDAPARTPQRGRQPRLADARATKLKEARKVEAEARRRAERAARNLSTAQERRDQAAQVLRDADAATAAARELADRAARELREAEKMAGKLAR
jgi:hypothetical protein